MNPFSDKTYYDKSNQVHLENVVGYYQMISDKPEMLLFGRRMIEDYDYKNINEWENYNLGTPHNAILAKIFYEGIVSLLLYLWINISFFIYCLRKRKQLNQHDRATIIGIVGFMIGHFILTLLFIPPETTFKGAFFMLFFMLSCINFIQISIKESKMKQKIGPSNLHL
tara:strand:- start:69 stop:572 length:504 start_codon:yes stop_codon:yes gene_type:complete